MPVRTRCLDIQNCLLQKAANDTGIGHQWLSRRPRQAKQQFAVMGLQLFATEA